MVMRIKTLWYCLIEGVKNLFKNRLMSLASILTIVASLFIVSIFYCITVNLNYTLDEFEHNIGIAIFFEDNVTENEMLTLKTQLEAREEVYQVTYISEEDAWNEFKGDYFEGREELLDGFDDDNPLAGSASLQVLFEDISRQDHLIRLLESEVIVRHVKEAREVAAIVENFNDLVAYISLALIVILSIISLFIISNTIRLGIALRKREINIMRYIGAKTLMIRGPFIVEGALIGLIGASIPLLAISYFYNQVVQSIITQFYLLKDFLVFIPVEELMVQLTPIMLISGASLGVIGSRFTIGRYLKV
jgi:cell division transport system permease protein